MRAMVCVVKLCLPVSHLEISESRWLSNRAKSFWVSPLAFRISLMRSAIPKDKSNSAFCSVGIAARQSRNNLFCIMTLKYKMRYSSLSKISIISAAVITCGSFGKCLRLPVTRKESSLLRQTS